VRVALRTDKGLESKEREDKVGGLSEGVAELKCTECGIDFKTKGLLR
jgi:hypothetical protein